MAAGTSFSTPRSDLMKSWIDTCMEHDHIWLVLVFHGVDGVGWESIPGDTLNCFFSYIKSHEDASMGFYFSGCNQVYA